MIFHNNKPTAQQLLQLSKQLLTKAGLSTSKAQIVAELLLEGDLLGHRTHGLQLLESYITEIENGGMTAQGNPSVLSDKGAVILWDGRYLPGVWLVQKAIEKAIKRVKKYGTATIVIQKSHHIACLAAYIEAVTNQNLMILLACSDPRNRTVAPYGGMEPVYSPNPIAVGIPTSGEPIIMDISMSATANAIIAQKHQANEKLPYPWLLNTEGVPTDDPSTFFATPPSTILPLGGMDVGYKGFGLGIMVEAMTNALGGYGRAEHPTHWGASVFLQIIDPSVFSGINDFNKETDFLKNECLKSKPIDSQNPVRIPGSKGLKLKKEQLENGVNLNASTLAGLERLALKYKMKI